MVKEEIMSYKNYSNYSKRNETSFETNDYVEETLFDEEPDVVNDENESVSETVEDVVDEPVKFVTGKVYNCTACYLRAQPNREADYISILDSGSELFIVEDLEDWYKVQAGSFIGFIMKDYVSID